MKRKKFVLENLSILKDLKIQHEASGKIISKIELTTEN